MSVRAVFELPVHIWVTSEALGATYPTGSGALRFSVVMPEEGGPFGAPPALPGAELLRQVPGEELVWHQEYAAFIPPALQPATAVHRVGITDVDGPEYAHLRWFTPEHQLAEYISRWFDDVRTWVEVLTGQDLDPHHRVYDAEPVGAGLTFIEPPDDGALGLRITTPRVLPLRASEWKDILTLVRDGREPPLEEVLSRDARAAQRRHADRRAIIDAATALEIALGRHIRSLAGQLPERQRRRIGARTALGDYISIAEHSRLELAVGADRLRWLNELRNDAAHRGRAPDSMDAAEAIQLMIDFLGAHGELRRTGERQPDGSEWVLADMDTEDMDARQFPESTSLPSPGAGL